MALLILSDRRLLFIAGKRRCSSLDKIRRMAIMTIKSMIEVSE